MNHRVVGRGLPLGLAEWAGPDGPRAGPPALLLHGFTGCGADWAPVATRLGRRALAPDLLGHGRSVAPRATAPYALRRQLGRLLGLLDRLGLERVAVVGYSLGGRLAWHLALDRPDRVAALALIGATPGLEGIDARARRAADDDALAAAARRDGAAAFLRAWRARPLLATQARAAPLDRRRLDRWRRRCSPDGLAATLEALSPGVLPARWPDLERLAAPLLLVTGQDDPAYGAIARDVVARLGRGRHVVVPGAGHAAHLERPAAVAAALRSFLAGHGA